MKGPRKLPRVTSTTVAASSPPACFVMTTLELMVVGSEPVAIRPTRVETSICWFVRAAQATPKKAEEVTRKDMTWTMRWRRTLRVCLTQLVE
jgi:hypothetical protein